MAVPIVCLALKQASLQIVLLIGHCLSSKATAIGAISQRLICTKSLSKIVWTRAERKLDRNRKSTKSEKLTILAGNCQDQAN